MHHRLVPTCDADGCDRVLTDAEFRMAYAEGAMQRCAYECSCGAITISVARAT